MTDEEKKDILFQIDMQLYDEFNDKFCEMNDNLGTIYTYKDIDDLEKLEKEKEIKLLREAIKKQFKEIEELKMQLEVEKIDNKYNKEEAYEETIPRYKLKEVLEKYKYTEIGNSEKIIEFYKELQSLLEKE